jgi:hypothetical protein
MSVYEIFSSTQPHESSNLDAKLRKILQRFLPAHLKDKPKKYVQKGKSNYPRRKKRTKIVTPPPSPKTVEHNQPVVPLEEIEKAIEDEEEEEEEI